MLWQPGIGHLHGKRAEEDTAYLKSTVEWSLGRKRGLRADAFRSSGLKAEGFLGVHAWGLGVGGVEVWVF